MPDSELDFLNSLCRSEDSIRAMIANFQCLCMVEPPHANLFAAKACIEHLKRALITVESMKYTAVDYMSNL